MDKEYFMLNNKEYTITSTSIGVYETDKGIQLFPEINAKNDQVEYELSEISLYHNNGFMTGVKKVKDLASKRFVWDKAQNSKGEEAGYLCVVEHEEVTSGTIEILEVSNKDIVIQWTGTANVFWNDDLGADVPFETVVSIKLPQKRKIKLNAYKSVRTKINKDLEIELLNFEEIEAAADKMQQSRIWDDFNVTLHFKVTYKGKDYFGDVKYTDGKNNYETFFDETCPIKVTNDGFGWSTVLGYFEFVFMIEFES